MLENDKRFLQALEEVCDEEYDAQLKALENRTPHRFSDRHNRKMDKVIRQQKSPFSAIISHAGKIAACFIAAVIIVSVYVSVSRVKADRGQIFDFVLSPNSGTMSVTVSKGSADGYPKSIEEEYCISELPEGFERSDVTRSDTCVKTTYSKGSEMITLTQYTKRGFEQDYGDKDSQYIVTNDTDKAMYLMILNASGTTVLWDNGKYIFEIISNSDKDSALDLCRSTKIQK